MKNLFILGIFAVLVFSPTMGDAGCHQYYGSYQSCGVQYCQPHYYQQCQPRQTQCQPQRIQVQVQNNCPSGGQCPVEQPIPISHPEPTSTVKAETPEPAPLFIEF